MKFRKIMFGVHYVLLAVCVACVGLLMAVRGGSGTWLQIDDMTADVLVGYPMTALAFGLPVLFAWDVIGLAIKEFGYRPFWVRVMVMDFMMGVLFVRAYILMDG